MKAAQIRNYGDPSVVSIINDAPKPIAGEGQVLVEVHSSSINPVDTALRSGYLQQIAPLQLPVTLGTDISGVVAELGSGVDELSVGDRVYGSAIVLARGSGAFAEYAAVSASSVAKLPAGLDFNQAAALPLAGVSALQAIAEHIKLQSGQKILIQGGSGGIGVFATALAKHLGAYVATTVSGASADYANEIGADEVIDYKTQDFSTILSDYDAVFDLVGGEVYEKSFKVLKKGGILVSTVAQANNKLADTHGVTTLTQQTMVNTRRLNELAKLVQDGVIKVKIDSIFPLAQISQAFIKQESGGVRGKVVVEVKK